ncbi:MAG TPA: hypothetical protein VHG92_03120 [Afifellaceae bacterium]|nr:hypothetical protein [Afifellaceae bacterium]
MTIRRLAVAMFAAVLPSAAAADCTCRAKGVVADQGELVCLATPQGERMARCDKVLNNASWTFLEQPCSVPLVTGSPAAPTLERLAAATLQPAER